MDKKAYLEFCLENIVEGKGQDVFLKSGASPRMRIGAQVIPLPFRELTHEEARELVRGLLTSPQWDALEKNRSVDFGFTFREKGCRFRGNAFYQQGNLSLVLRLLWRGVPGFDELNLPPILGKVAMEKSGIVLIAGTVSSGKSTTIAALINAMNKNVQRHIITLEDPIEYLFEDEQCLIQQREIGEDAENFGVALKYVVRQSPDVVVIGEMRDAESFRFSLAAAEVGRLVISSIHAQSVPQVFDRFLGFFPAEERDAALRHFAANVSCIAVQKLLTETDGKTLVPAVEILLGNFIVRQLIMEKKIEKLDQALRNCRQEGMQTMEQSLFQLWESGKITRECALAASPSPQEMEAMIKGIHIGQDTKILGD
ncbi:MAG: PilT/PilU family type 4a pilus ATPase [Candidatus Omnitrophica bacterium]|nr:PilT/PilU family type 4a pilus ATPase [Candidatus Omnitrophota bacterium]